MNIIQSCWSCNSAILFEYPAGWAAPEYNLMSWTLSCLQLSKYYKNTILYSDYASARVLIDELKLPYTSVRCELDQLNKFNSQLWALPKIFAYSKQEEPFLHVDADVFIWKPFEDSLMSSGLIAQNLELVNDYYENIIRSLDGNLKYFPKEVLNEMKPSAKFFAYNAGIMGGSDLGFFREYTSKALEFINRNTSYFNLIDVSDFNVVFEQYLFYGMVKDKGKIVGVLFSEILEDYPNFGDFFEVPHNKQYLHLLGLYKQHKPAYEQMANRLRLDYPEYYYRIIALFKNKKLPLKKTFYTSINCTSENQLIERYAILSNNYLTDSIKINDQNDTARIFEPSVHRIELVKKAINYLIKENGKKSEFFLDHLADIEVFEKGINNILNTKFAYYSSEYLYARDIYYPKYFQIIFGNKLLGYDIKIITDPIFEILENRYNWSEIDFGEFGEILLFEQLESDPTNNFTAVIPECDLIGYSLTNVDELDLRILEICKYSSTINKVLHELTAYFEPADLDESQNEYEELIIGRIKMALTTKLIRVVLN